MARRTRAETVRVLVEKVLEDPNASLEALTCAAIRLGLSTAIDKPESIGVERVARLIESGGRALSGRKGDGDDGNGDEAVQKWLTSGGKSGRKPKARVKTT